MWLRRCRPTRRWWIVSAPAEDLNLQQLIAAALTNKGDAFRQLDDPASAVSAYEEVVERFGATEDPDLQWLGRHGAGLQGGCFPAVG